MITLFETLKRGNSKKMLIRYWDERQVLNRYSKRIPTTRPLVLDGTYHSRKTRSETKRLMVLEEVAMNKKQFRNKRMIIEITAAILRWDKNKRAKAYLNIWKLDYLTTWPLLRRFRKQMEEQSGNEKPYLLRKIGKAKARRIDQLYNL